MFPSNNHSSTLLLYNFRVYPYNYPYCFCIFLCQPLLLSNLILWLSYLHHTPLFPPSSSSPIITALPPNLWD
ncbi:putative hemolysin B [Neisseria meningitidis 2008223]|nr:putative hemolysin B [Neisseria meningitidis 2008223]